MISFDVLTHGDKEILYVYCSEESGTMGFDAGLEKREALVREQFRLCP